jgi:hypothetical protein
VLCLAIGKEVDLELLECVSGYSVVEIPVLYENAAVPTVWKNSGKGLPSRCSNQTGHEK